MKMYKGKKEADADKDQVPAMKKAGWSTQPLKVEVKKVEVVEVKEGVEVTESPESAAEEQPKKVTGKKLLSKKN